MPQPYIAPPKFTLALDHLDAIRTLHEYVTGVGLKKDVQDLTKYLQQDLSRNILAPHGWEELHAENGYLYSTPKSLKWQVAKGKSIAIEIGLQSPIPLEYEPFIGFCVPNWKKRSLLIKKLEPPPGFQHCSQYPAGELAEDSAIFQYVPYTKYVKAKGKFDSTGFINAFRAATKVLVAMEKGIDKILLDLA